MSVRYWAYRDACMDHADICSAIGCDNCPYAEEPFDDEVDDADEDWNDPDGFDMWRNGMVRHPKGFINYKVLRGKW